MVIALEHIYRVKLICIEVNECPIKKGTVVYKVLIKIDLESFEIKIEKNELCIKV